MSEAVPLFDLAVAWTSKRALPPTWAWTTLGEATTIVGGSTPESARPDYWSGDIPWLGVTDLTGYDQKHISAGARFITQAGYDACSTQLVPAGTVLFSSRAPVGYVAVAGQPVCTSQGFKSFVPSEAVSSDYLYWYLKANTRLAERFATGTTFSELSGKRAAQIPLALPPLGEQTRIVEAIEDEMGRLDGASDAALQAEKDVSLLRVSVLAELGRTDAPIVRVGDLGEVFVGATPKRAVREFWNGDIPWVSSGEVAFCRISKTRETISELGLGKRDRRLQPPGSVLLAMYGEGKTRGQAAVLDIEAATNQAVAVVRLDREKMLPEFCTSASCASTTRCASSGEAGNSSISIRNS